MKNQIYENINKNLEHLIYRLGKKFELTLTNNIYREYLTEKDYKQLGNIKTFYTIGDMELQQVGFDKNYIHLIKYNITIESESNVDNGELLDLALFLKNESATHLFIWEDNLKSNKEFKRKIRNCNILSNKNYYGRNNNIYYKKVISFDVVYEVELKGGLYKWQ